MSTVNGRGCLAAQVGRSADVELEATSHTFVYVQHVTGNAYILRVPGCLHELFVRVARIQPLRTYDPDSSLWRVAMHTAHTAQQSTHGKHSTTRQSRAEQYLERSPN